MKKIVLLSAAGLVGALGAPFAQAQEVGRVISSTPIIQQVSVPRQVCSQQPVAVQQPSSSGGGAVVGAIVGGLLGNTVGHGMGRAAATGVGAVAGAAVGDNVERRGNVPATAMQQYCTTQTTYENRTTAYNVVYEYAGKQYTVQLPYDPGPTVQLRVSPVAESAPAPVEGVQGAAAPVAQPGAPVGVILAESPPVVYQSYTPYYYPQPYYYPPVGISLGFGYTHFSGGHGHWRH